jgi:hypothetical protein
VKDWFHKHLAPSTYPCALCRITHGTTGSRPSWLSLVDEPGPGAEVWHRDEFAIRYPQVVAHAPAVWAVDEAESAPTGAVWTLVVGPDAWPRVPDLATLHHVLSSWATGHR